MTMAVTAPYVKSLTHSVASGGTLFWEGGQQSDFFHTQKKIAYVIMMLYMKYFYTNYPIVHIGATLKKKN